MIMREKSNPSAKLRVSPSTRLRASASVPQWTEVSETIVLNKEEWERFLALLDNPPPPSEALMTAMRGHRECLVISESSPAD